MGAAEELAVVSGRGEELAERGRVLGVTPSMRARSPALSRGRACTAPHSHCTASAVRPPLGAGEDRRQLGVAQRADAVPLEFGAAR